MSVSPVRYVIQIEPDVELTSFRGTVDISLKTVGEVERFSFHADPSLVFESTWLNGKACYGVTRVKDVVTVHAYGVGVPTSLKIVYSGVIDGSGTGLYRNQMSGCPGLATQLFATYARRLFPCWDEPKHKAVFQVELLLDQRIKGHAYSNMPAVTHTLEREGTLRRVVFEPTPIMSCYLLAIFVGVTNKVRTFTKRSVPITVVVPLGEEDKGALKFLPHSGVFMCCSKVVLLPTLLQGAWISLRNILESLFRFQKWISWVFRRFCMEEWKTTV